MEENWNAKTCLSQDWGNLNGNLTENGTVLQYCPPVWDGFSCWGPTLAETIASARCPSFKGSDVTKSAFRICGANGQWLDRNGVPSLNGWTNYTPCLTPEIREIMRRMGSNDDAQTKFNIAANTRILEFVGLSLSLAALLVSLLIFYYFRTLRNSRTRLHRHLFIAMAIQVGVRLIVYTDQAITRSMGASSDGISSTTNVSAYTPSYNSTEAPDGTSANEYPKGIDNTPILCEASYISLEYARTAMFMWMFVEGLFLHNMITVTVFEEKLSPLVYPIIGWIIPIPLTFAWALVTHLHYGGTATCWWGYNFTLYFWILEGPRLAVLMVNLAFLLNILRVLVMKLRQSNSSETQQAMKAVKAALVLLPLLGLTNLLNMIDAPLEKSPFQFALWSYSTHLLTSTQGFILAFLYCFRNGEVQIAVRKFIRIRILGNPKHTTISKKPIPLSALENNTYLQNCCNPMEDASCSQTVNMLNTQNSPVVIFTQNGETQGNYHNGNGNNNTSANTISSSKPTQSLSGNNGYPKLTTFSSPARSPPCFNNQPAPKQQPPLIVRSFSNGVLKQTTVKPRSKPNQQPSRNHPESHCLLQRNSSNLSDDQAGIRPLISNQQKVSVDMPPLASQSQVTTITLAATGLQQQQSGYEPAYSETTENIGMTTSSSWSAGSGMVSCSTSTSGCYSFPNKEHPHNNHHPSTSSSLEFQSSADCPQNNSPGSGYRINKIGKQIANSWGMLIIPEPLLKRIRGQQPVQQQNQQTGNSLVYSSNQAGSSPERNGRQKKRLISVGSGSIEVVAKEEISERDMSTTSSGGSGGEGPERCFSVEMISSTEENGEGQRTKSGNGGNDNRDTNPVFTNDRKDMVEVSMEIMRI